MMVLPCFTVKHVFRVVYVGDCEDFLAYRRGEYVISDKCPVHTMAAWIHHLLTKVKQMKLMRSIFMCCA